MKKLTQNKNLIKALVIFLGCMLFFTFFSKTAYYYMTPKVYCQQIKGGRLEKMYYVELNKDADGNYSARLDRFAKQYFKTGQSYKFEIGKDKYDFKISKVTLDDFFTTLTFRPVDEISIEIDNIETRITPRTISVSSEEYELIIPKIAVISGSFIYCAINTPSYFGEQQTIYRLDVEVLNENDYECAIKIKGFMMEGEIVTGWDRAIYDRDNVIVLRR